MYRPKNWGRRVGGIIKNREPVFASDRLRENRFMVEAGADAMLEALESQEHQDWLATPEGESCSGRWIFIPDEK